MALELNNKQIFVSLYFFSINIGQQTGLFIDIITVPST